MKQKPVTHLTLAKNSQTKSIVEQDTFSTVNQDVVSEKELTPCFSCKGKKKLKGMFDTFPCGACSGLGIDLSNPLGVIGYFLDVLSQQKAKDDLANKEVKPAGYYSEAETMARFYEEKKQRNKNAY